MKVERFRMIVKGIVQGVGFRPFVHGLAESLFLCGWIRNTGDGVVIEVEGKREALDEFRKRLRTEAPILSMISSEEVEILPPEGYSAFEILKSEPGSGRNTYISPDVSVCADCSRELSDKADRRYLYPFINCTHCGPRFTIIRDIPYDRPNTTMAEFPMCPACRAEYEDIRDRRYHAQPVACPVCGPRLTVRDSRGQSLEMEDPAGFIAGQLFRGRIAAIKGIGGYHLSCDAYDPEAVDLLRKRKQRDEKPFAIMADSIETVRRHCYLDEKEEELLNSVERPIVLLKRKPDCRLPENISPGNPFLGVMLPYAPLHLLLFRNAAEPGKDLSLGGFKERDGLGTGNPEGVSDTLVMTSGNISSEPICYKDDEALEQLSGIADFFLSNNREIHIRTDDSVTRIFQGREYLIRRSRGYVPKPVTVGGGLSLLLSRPVLACGGELKSTFCLSKNNDFYLSHHIGDLENLQTLKSFEEGIGHFQRLFDIKPALVAYDLHPRYLSTQYALKLDLKDKLAVQHHHAHVAACMAENGLDGNVIGVAFDGTGFGEDGNIWGSEFFSGTYGSFRREAHLSYVRLPGGEAAVREPLRMLLSYLHGTGTDPYDALELAAGRLEKKNRPKLLDPVNVSIVNRMLEKGLNSPLASSMGRLFDAASAAAGICLYSSFEGQAAMELEFAARKGEFGRYEYGISEKDGMLEIDAGRVLLDILEDVRNNVSKGIISSRFHQTVAEVVIRVCDSIRSKTGYECVVLSGGVFQNMLLLSKCVSGLSVKGFKVYTHSRVPANDGGISLGQAVTAAVVAGKR